MDYLLVLSGDVNGITLRWIKGHGPFLFPLLEILEVILKQLTVTFWFHLPILDTVICEESDVRVLD